MKQITVVVDDRPGMLAILTEALAKRHVNIESIDGESAPHCGVLNLCVDRYDEALIALRDAGFQAVSEDALLIRIEDRPGALAQIAARFAHAALNIRSLRILRREGGSSLVALVSDDNQAASELVSDILANAPPSSAAPKIP